MEEERLYILRMVDEGRITADEAAELLAALGGAEPVEAEPAPARAADAGLDNPWSAYWIYILLAGGALLIAGALTLGLLSLLDAAPFCLLCGWLPVVLGVAVAIAAWWSRTSTWLHLRIHDSQTGRRTMALSFPLPLTLAAWGLRVAQPFVPQLRDTGVDDLIIALRASSAEGQPLVVDVQDDEDGEHVQIYIG